jgi:hypothetical protein
MKANTFPLQPPFALPDSCARPHAAYLAKTLASEVPIQTSDHDMLVVDVSSSRAELQQVWQELRFINGNDMKLMVPVTKVCAQLTQAGCCKALLRRRILQA